MRAGGVRRRAVLLTLALVSLALGPVLYAAATPGGRDAAGPPSLTGTLTKVDLRHHDVAVKVAKGAAKYRGRTVTLIVTSSPPGATSVTRLGHKAKLASIKKGDRVVVTYRLNAHKQLVAIHVIDSGPAPAHGPAQSPTASPTMSLGPTSSTTSSTTSSPSPTPSTVAVELHASGTGASAHYLTTTISISVGQSVLFVVDDGSHSWTSGAGGAADHNAWDDSTVLSGGHSFGPYTFNTAGSYPFFCSVHYPINGMSGTVNVS